MFFVFFILTIRFYSQKCIIFALRFEKRCKISINFLNNKIIMEKNYFIIKNGKVLASCVYHRKALKLFNSICSKSDPNCDLVHLFERGYGIIDEF